MAPRLHERTWPPAVPAHCDPSPAAMIDALSEAGSWLLQQAVTFPDTIVTRTVAAERGWFERLTAVASGIMSLALMALAVALVPAAWNFRKTYAKWNSLLDRVYGDVNPIMRHASNIADNVDYVTTAIRTDVQQLNATIAMANKRLQDAVAMTETRMRDFNALLAVVQEEAEQGFVSTAATVRGVRAGAAAFRQPVRRPVGMDLAEEDASEPHRLDEDLDEEIEEMIDGDDSDPQPSAQWPARPRIRPRRSGRG